MKIKNDKTANEVVATQAPSEGFVKGKAASQVAAMVKLFKQIESRRKFAL
jgi:hypothetical protein